LRQRQRALRLDDETSIISPLEIVSKSFHKPNHLFSDVPRTQRARPSLMIDVAQPPSERQYSSSAGAASDLIPASFDVNAQQRIASIASQL
jgi:hypothetical protein